MAAGYHQSSVAEHLANATAYLNQVNALRKVQTTLSLHIFPQPAQNHLWVNVAEPVSSMSIYNLQGKILIQQKVTGTSFETNLSQISSGIYIIELNCKNGDLLRKKLIVH